MSQTRDSRRTVLQRIASQRHADWPVYDSTPLHDRSSLNGLESDIRTVSRSWFGHDLHESVEQFVRSLPLAHFNFNAHDRCAGPTHYQMELFFIRLPWKSAKAGILRQHLSSIFIDVRGPASNWS